MTTPNCDTLIDWRERLAGLGIAADDLDDGAVGREARYRAMAGCLARCTMTPGIPEKRFVRELPTYPKPVTARQAEWLDALWRKYRRQLPRATTHADGRELLPPVAAI